MKFDTKELRKRALVHAHNNAHAQLALSILCDYLDECGPEEVHEGKAHKPEPHPKSEPPPPHARKP